MFIRYLVLILIFVIALVLVTTLRISVGVCADTNAANITLKIVCRLFFFNFKVFKTDRNFVYKSLLPGIDKKKEKTSRKKKNKWSIHAVRKITGGVTVEKMNIIAELGTGDAAQTAVLCGFIYSLGGGITGIVSHFSKGIESVEVKAIPNFSDKAFKSDVQCIFSMQTADIIRRVILTFLLRR